MGDLILPEKTKPERLIKSKKRVKQFGEVFTPEFIVKQMCDLCEPEISRINGKVFEPTCGNGNFLVEILRRKLAKIKFKNQKQFEFEIILALSNIYAVDIQADNVREARSRLHDIVLDFVSKRKSSIYFLNAVEFILSKTILVGNTLTQKSELKFYDFQPNYEDFSFEISQHSLKEIEENFAKTKKANLENLKSTIEKIESPPEKLKLKSKPKRKLETPASPNDGKDSKLIQQATLF